MSITIQQYIPKAKPVNVVAVTEENLDQIVDVFFKDSGFYVGDSKLGRAVLTGANSVVCIPDDVLVFNQNNEWIDTLEDMALILESYDPAP